MTSRINAKQPPRKAQTANAQKPPANPASPSVPISLYREVATELKATQTKLESLSLQNQQLTQQNQQLRVEIERVVQSALQLRQVADAHMPKVNQPTAASPLQGLELHFQHPPAPVSPPATEATEREVESNRPVPMSLFTEQEATRSTTQTELRSEKSGWWLALVIGFIILTAFGTGFLIVRPLLPSR